MTGSPLGAHALGDRHGLRDRDGLGRSRQRVLHPRARRSDRAVPGRTRCRCNGALGNVELWREAATLVMLATLGMLAGRTWRRRAGYAALAFGAWDIFYYVFLRIISGWPRTLLDWDILFLLPLPWWGPVLAPVSIALVMILWGTLATQSEDGATDARWAVGAGLRRDRAGARRLHDRRLAGAAAWPRRGPAGAADDVQLAAVLGGLAADGVTGPSSARLPADEEISYFLRAALMSASMWSRYFSNARRPAALNRYSVRGVRPANVFSHST